MATAENTAPAEAQTPSYEELRDRLLSLVATFRVVGRALPSDDDAATVLEDATERLDRFQEALEAWYEDRIQAPAGAVLEACRERNLELIESLARRIAEQEAEGSHPS
jgi:hypothetical protein